MFLRTVDRLVRHFSDCSHAEMAGRAPITAIERDGHAVSVCCCARRSGHAAEAGLETTAAFRRAGLGARVAAAWATAVRASGRVPLYSASWSDTASLAVAARLNLPTRGASATSSTRFHQLADLTILLGTCPERVRARLLVWWWERERRGGAFCDQVGQANGSVVETVPVLVAASRRAASGTPMVLHSVDAACVNAVGGSSATLPSTA